MKRFKSNSFLVVSLFPFLVTAILSILLNIGSLYQLQLKFLEGSNTQIKELDVVIEAAKLSADMASIQTKIAKSLENADQVNEAELYAFHSEFVESFALLEPRIIALSKNKHALDASKPEALALVKHFNEYRNFVIMAGDIAAIDPYQAINYIAESRKHFVDFSNKSNRIAEHLASAVSEQSQINIDSFNDVFVQVIIIVIVGFILMSIFSINNIKSVVKKIELISSALQKLSSEHNYPTELPKIRLMEFKESEVFKKLARAVLSFHQVILERNKVKEELLSQQQHLQELVDERTKDLIKAIAKAEAANVAKSSFLANMSHEIRTPLNAIIGFTHILKNTKVANEKDRANKLLKISNSAQHLLSVINNILDFSKIEAGKLSLEHNKFEIEQVFNNVYMMIEEKVIKKNLECIIDIDPKLPDFLEGDSLRLGQVLINFANNSVKFTETGSITIKAELLDKTELEKNELEKKGHAKIKLSIIDTGIGLSEEQQQKLFQAFEQADDSTTRKYGGTGLGLAISKRIASLMGGEVGVESIVDKGSSFWMTGCFKIIEKDKQETDKIKKQILNSQRVLIVDDLPEALEIHHKLLEQMNIRNDIALGGYEALEKAKQAIEAEDPYTIILMDLVMPGMNGIETTRHIKEIPNLSNTLNIMVTGHSEEMIEQNSEQDINLFNAILSKPVSPSQMHDVLMDVVGATSETKMIKVEAISRPNWTGLPIDILVVEDNEVNQEVIQDLLNSVGLTIRIANNGQEAIDELSVKEPDLVLMDIQMPIMDGFKATQQIRTHKIYQNLPIIAMTANAFKEDKERCITAGMNQHLAKPIDPNELYKLLLQYLPKPVDISAQESQPWGIALQQLDTIPELSVEKGLYYNNNNEIQYIKELKHFSVKMETAVEQIKDLYSKQKFEDASRLAHTLKGLSSTLGIQTIAPAAQKLEKDLASLSKTESDDELERKEILLIEMELLEQHLAKVIHALHENFIPEDIKPEQHYSKEQIKTILMDFKQLLENSDYQCAGYIETHNQAIIQYFNDDKNLETIVMDYNFDEALKIVESLLEQLT